MTPAFRLFVALLLTALPAAASATEPPLSVPFDFSKHAIGMNVIVRIFR